MGAERITYGSDGVRRRGVHVKVGDNGIGQVTTGERETVVRRRPGDYIGVEVTGWVAGQKIWWETPRVPKNKFQKPSGYFHDIELAETTAEAAVRRRQADLGVLPTLRLVREHESVSDTDTVPDNVINAAGRFERRRFQALQPIYINVLR